MAGVGLLALVGHAQAPAGLPATQVSYYQAEFDSLQARAARVRSLTNSRIERFRSSFAAVGGTSRRTHSYARLGARNASLPASKQVYRLVKKHIAKHKTSGVELEKVSYYGPNGLLLLAERYENHQLVRQYLYEAGPAGRSGGASRRTEWVRGDYLRLEQHQAGAPPANYYYTAPRAH